MTDGRKAAGKRTQAEPAAAARRDTVLVHGRDGTAWAHGATLPPVVYATAFQHATAEGMEAAFAGQADDPLYSRLGNPTVAALEARVSEACEARGCLAVASGMSALSLVLLGLLRAGDEVVASRLLFGGTYTLLTRTLAQWGVTTHLVHPADPAAAEAHVNERTRLVLLEAIANPAMVVPHLAEWRALCDRHGLPLVLDATLLTPYLYDNAALGADVAVFSASKFLAGAASGIGGLVVDTGRMDWRGCARLEAVLGEARQAGDAALLVRLRKRLMADVGPCLAPMNAFLLLTGLETLGLRLERQCANAESVAAYLAAHPRVLSVAYPGLVGHPQHALAARQFRGRYGSVLSFTLADKAACFRFLNALRMVRRVTNLGDTKTLALHPASTIYGTLWAHEQAEVGVSEGMVRLSLGIEHPDDIVADLAQALEA